MIGSTKAVACIPVRDLESARRFYEDTLGCEVLGQNEGGLMLAAGDGSELFVYPTEHAGTARHTLVSFRTDHVDDEIAYDVVVTNDGNKSASSVTLTIALPATHNSFSALDEGFAPINANQISGVAQQLDDRVVVAERPPRGPVGLADHALREAVDLAHETCGLLLGGEQPADLAAV